MRKGIALFLSVLLLFSFLSRFQVQSVYGYAIKPQFASVQRFSEGLAGVFMDQWGYIDKNGKFVIPPTYDYVLPFSEGLAAVATDRGWGFIDRTGHMIIEPRFDTLDIQQDDIGGFMEGLAAVSINDRWGFIDKSGNVVIEPQYDYALSFSEGMAAVRQNDKWGYINKQGEVIIEFTYDLATPFSEGAAAAYFAGGWGFINKEGDAFTGFIYSEPSTFKDGLAPVDDGFIDLDGTLVIDFLDEHYYDRADSFHDGISVVYKIMQREFYYGFMDRQGREIIAPQFPFISQVQFREGFGAIYENDQWGFMDRTGKTVIPPQFEDISGDFHEGMVGVSVDGKWGFIDANFHTPAWTSHSEEPSRWAVEEVAAAAELQLIPTHMDNQYTTHITRQQFSELVVRLFSIIEGVSIDQWLAYTENEFQQNIFKDTNDIMVLAAHHLGIVHGKGQGIFDPNGEITRQEAAVMLQRTAQNLGVEVSTNSIRFTDQASIPSWAINGVLFVSSLKDASTGYAVMSGVNGNRFDPKGKYTREQAFITIKRLYHAF